MKKVLTNTIAATLAATSLLTAGTAAAQTKIGFLYVGPTSDYGYNFAQDEGRKYLEANMDVETLYFENIPETAAATRVMERMIRDGVEIVFPTSYGHLDYAMRIADDYPDVHFMHSGGLETANNLGTYFAEIDQAMYLSGVAAGLTTETNELGFIGANPIPQVLRNINAFTRGARSVNPEVTTSIVWTGEWSNPGLESEAANSLIDSGADVLTGHVDSPINYVQVAERRGVYSVGYHADASQFAPNGWIVGAQWNWGPMMVDIVSSIQDGTWEPEHLRGDLRSEASTLTDFGDTVPQEVRDVVNNRYAEIMDGEFAVWAGPVLDQSGAVIIPEGETLSLRDTETMDYLVEGVVGRLP